MYHGKISGSSLKSDVTRTCISEELCIGQYAEKWDDNSVAVCIGRSWWYFTAIGAR